MLGSTPLLIKEGLLRNYYRSAFFLVVILFHLTEPVKYLNGVIARATLRVAKSALPLQTSKIVLGSAATTDELINAISSHGVGRRPILIFGIPADLRDERLRDAVTKPLVVWVSGSNDRSIKRSMPIVISPVYGCGSLTDTRNDGVIISAASVALNEVPDLSERRTLVTHAFDASFESMDGSFTHSLDPRLLCIGRTSSSSERITTPGGRQSPIDYAAEICEAVLSRNYLIRRPWLDWSFIIGFACLQAWATSFRFVFLSSILVFPFGLLISLSFRTHIPFASLFFAALFSATHVHFWKSERDGNFVG